MGGDGRVRSAGGRRATSLVWIISGAGIPRHVQLRRCQMIVAGLILLLVGVIAKVSILWTLGVILLVVGGVLMLLGMAGREIGGRRHYY